MIQFNFVNIFCGFDLHFILIVSKLYVILQMGLGEYERTNMRYGDSQPTTTARYSLMPLFLN